MAISNKFLEFQLIKFDFFKSQNPETGRFDVTFSINGKELYAHKTMLNLVSDTFDSMLSDRWNTNKEEPIKIVNYTFEDFYQFLTFLYSAQCQLDDTNIFTMVNIAEFYGVALFKSYCDEYLSSMKLTPKNIFKMLELADKYSMTQLRVSGNSFIVDNFNAVFNCKSFLQLSKSVIQELVVGIKDKVRSDELFQAVYKWTEKEAMKKQGINPNLILNDVIKNEISDFLPNINFFKMNLEFLNEFIVPRGFIFSYNELSKILCDRHSRPMITITNALGQTLSGNLIADKKAVANIKTLLNQDSYGANWWNAKFRIPSTPSPLKKRNDVKWYLIYFRTKEIGFKECSEINEGHYLLAELDVGASGFQLSNVKGCRIEMQ